MSPPAAAGRGARRFGAAREGLHGAQNNASGRPRSRRSSVRRGAAAPRAAEGAAITLEMKPE